MKIVTLIFPHQLMKEHPALNTDVVFLTEEILFFNQFKFHKQKLVLHRASMKFYEQWLHENKINAEYIEAKEKNSDVRRLIATLAKKNIEEIHVADVSDNWLLRRMQSACNKFSIKLVIHPTPYFINTMDEAREYFKDKNKFFQTDFYVHERKKRKILLTVNSQPEGGKWSFDYENRKRFPKNKEVPKYTAAKINDYVREARKYVEENYKNNYGEINDPFSKSKGFYPTTFGEAEHWLDDFIKHRFQNFGLYEDAVVANEQVLNHSVLSSSLNTGLITPGDVVKKVLKEAKAHNIPINSLEGYIRQIIGWRELMRIVYEIAGRKQRTKNYWNFTRKIPAIFWKGSTGIEPIDTTINKVLQSAYTHHIERLMIIGNFMLLCEFDPNDVYKWFMELFIDAYDWVMVPNVYGMSQFADGGMMSTKPYISGSNYLMKMSDYKKGGWQHIWDSLFWRFMYVHRGFFTGNRRIGMLVQTFDKMDINKRNDYLNTAEDYLHELDKEVK